MVVYAPIIVLISIIIPVRNETEQLDRLLATLDLEVSEFEVIVVAGDDANPSASQVKVVQHPATHYAAQLVAGIAQAGGEILLFLTPGHQLPVEALLTIQRNFELLPQTVGGNFHLKFKPTSLPATLINPLLKRWRYRGRYFFSSGIFIRTTVYHKIGGLRPETRFADLDLVQRMEKYGPTLYLPDTLIAPPPSLRQAATWLVAPFLSR